MLLLNGKTISELGEIDLNNLIAEGKGESKTLEFKRDLCGSSDSDKKEFLADVSAFANAAGGIIIYGIEEKNGVAISVPGVIVSNVDAEKLRLENIIRDGVAPRIIGTAIEYKQISNGAYVFFIHIPISWVSPHMVTFKGTSRFYTRSSAGKYQMDVAEIRKAFLLTEATSEKIRHFRLSRLSKIDGGETPIGMAHGAKIVIHIIPLLSLQTPFQVDINQAASATRLLDENMPFDRYNLDGLLSFAEIVPRTKVRYFQLFRNGILEFVDNYVLSESFDGEAIIPSFQFETQTISVVKSALSFQKHLGVAPPVFVFLSLLNVEGFKMAVKRNPGHQESKIDRNQLIIPEILVENYPGMVEIPRLIKPALDMVWNAAGWPNSQNYDVDGNWAG